MTQPDENLIDRSTEDGTTVGAADAAEDARRAGADRDTPLRDTVEEGALDAVPDTERDEFDRILSVACGKVLPRDL